MAQKAFHSYDRLKAALRRAKVDAYGTTATVLLECFLHMNGQLTADYVKGKGLLDKRKFAEWRKELIGKGWLVYTVGDYSKHSPGPKLLKHINDEKMAQFAVATVDELNSATAKLAAVDLQQGQKLETHEQKIANLEQRNLELAKEVAAVKASVAAMIEEFDPPVTQDKIEQRLKLVGNSGAPNLC